MQIENEPAISHASVVLPQAETNFAALEFDAIIGFEKVKFALDALVVSNSFAEQPAKDHGVMNDWRVQKLLVGACADLVEARLSDLRAVVDEILQAAKRT